MKQFFKELFDYNHHFNQELFIVFRDHPEHISERANQLFNHMLNAHQIWNCRIMNAKIGIGVWELRAIQDLDKIETINLQKTLQIIDTHALSEMISYATMGGKKFSNSVRNILFHVINHSTYHRGQLALEFRKHGLDPLRSDYIAYKNLETDFPTEPITSRDRMDIQNSSEATRDDDST